MITITYTNFMAALGLFTALCVAVGWLLKIVKAMKAPADDIHKKLDNDNKRLTELEDQYKYIISSIGVLMRCDLVMLAHLRDGNNTGKMEKMEKEIQDFLIERK